MVKYSGALKDSRGLLKLNEYYNVAVSIPLKILCALLPLDMNLPDLTSQT